MPETQTLKALVNRIEMDADWRQGHSAELARLGELVGKRISQTDRDATATKVAAFLHESWKPQKPHLTLSLIDRQQDTRSLASRLVDAPQRAMEAIVCASLGLWGLTQTVETEIRCFTISRISVGSGIAASPSEIATMCFRWAGDFYRP